MLRTQAVEAGTLDLIRKFMSDARFNDFNLVGGTALALKIGHRLSIDIDLFSAGPFSAIDLGQHLTTTYNATKVRTLSNGVFCFVDGVKIDLISHQLEPTNPFSTFVETCFWFFVMKFQFSFIKVEVVFRLLDPSNVK